jgi:hypothetical protein
MTQLVGPRRALLSGVAGYRKQLIVNNAQVSADLTDFPILLSLTTDNDLASRCQSNGADLYITTADGVTTVPHEIEYFNSATGELQLWFKGDISSTTDTAFFLHYGDQARADSQDVTNVWDSDFDAVYHGGAPPSRAIAQDGIVLPIGPPIVYPTAYYYNGRTYTAWSGDSLDPYVTYYDHKEKTWETPVKAGTNPLSNDAHGIPAIIVDNSGYIHVMFGSHGDPMEYVKSTNPEDISAWTVQADIGTITTYANLIKANSGTIYMIHRYGDSVTGDMAIVERHSSDWNIQRTLVETESGSSDSVAYFGVEYDAANNRVYIGWCYYDDISTKRTDIYAAYYDLTLDKMYSIGGSDLGSTVEYTEYSSCLAVDSGVYETNFPSIHLDSNGYPHMIYPIDTATGWEAQHVKWNGSSWDSAITITDCDDNFNLTDFWFNDNGDIEAFVSYHSTLDDAEGGSLDHWRYTGGSWSKVSTIFNREGGYPSYDGVGRTGVVVNGLDTLRAITADVDIIDYTNLNLEIFALDNRGRYVPRSLTGSSIADSTANGKHIIRIYGASEVAAKVGFGWSFDGDNDYLKIPNDILADSTAWTIEGWYYPDGENTTETFDVQEIVDLRGQYKIDVQWIEADDGSNPSEFRLTVNDGVDSVFVYSSTSVENNWYHVVCTYDGTNLRMYVDGLLDGGPSAQDDATTETETSKIGKDYIATDRLWFFGKVDEVRISGVARSADFITTTYNNQSAPSTFITVGREMGGV